MLRSRLHAVVASFAFGLLGIAQAAAAIPAGASTAPWDMKEQVLSMTDFFDTNLPGVLDAKNITLHFTPKFSDVRDNEYIRYPLEVRYGLNNRWELTGGITPFGPNPLNSGVDHRWGPGEFKVGARYDVGRLLNVFDDMTVGFETRTPLGRPPIELNDHYTHVKPFIATARRLTSRPHVTFYANLSYDRSVELTHRDAPPPEVMRRNVVEVTPGLLYKPAELGYFTQYRFRHIAEEQEWHLAHEVRAGTIWDVPIARSEALNLPGKWQLELALKVRHEEGRGTHPGITARVNWRTSLREVLTHKSSNSAKSP